MSHLPVRTCIGCRARRGKPELVRIGVFAPGRVGVDSRRRPLGRGAYLCVDTAQDCLASVSRRDGLARSLGVTRGVIDYSELSAQLTAAASPPLEETPPSPPPPRS